MTSRTDVFSRIPEVLSPADFQGIGPAEIVEHFGEGLERRGAVDWVKHWLPYRCGDNWPVEAVKLLKRAGIDLNSERAFDMLTDFSWQARDLGMSASKFIGPGAFPDDLVDEPGVDGSHAEKYAFAVIGLQSARFDFNFGLVQEWVENSRAVLVPEHAEVAEAFEFFATVASESEFSAVTATKTKRILDWEFIKLRHLALHGLELSRWRRHGALMDALAQNILEDPKGTRDADTNALYRRADGLRRQASLATDRDEAEVHYREVLRCIDAAIGGLRASSPLIHADYVRERSMILNDWDSRVRMEEDAERQIAYFQAELDKRSQQVERDQRARTERLDERLHQVDAENRSMIFRILEVLALFVALLGIVVTAVASSIDQTLSMWERIGVISSASIFLIFFLVVVHLMVRRVYEDDSPRNKARKEQLRQLIRDEMAELNP